LQANLWVANNGSDCSPDPALGNLQFFCSRFTIGELAAGWSLDTRNRALFADRGMRHQVSLTSTVPGSEVEYWTLNYDWLQFLPLFGRFTAAFTGNLAFAQDFGPTTSPPPYRQFFAGGPDSVRGYRESRLGPKDNFGNPYGGNLKVVLRGEVLFPVPEKWRNSTRISFFYDIGNVFSTGHVPFFGRDGITPVDYEFSYDKLKHSTGVAVQWLAPLGIFRFSYAFPLNAYKGDSVVFKDETENFQFSVGQAF
jgi:outer membrane protein insertion porin family